MDTRSVAHGVPVYFPAHAVTKYSACRRRHASVRLVLDNGWESNPRPVDHESTEPHTVLAKRKSCYLAHKAAALVSEASVLSLIIIIVIRCICSAPGSARMCSGIELHAAGPACEKASCPNLVRSCGSEKSVDNFDLTRWRNRSSATIDKRGRCDDVISNVSMAVGVSRRKNVHGHTLGFLGPSRVVTVRGKLTAVVVVVVDLYSASRQCL